MLYKYRSLSELKFFIDIILNSRLFASSYFDLNDPMEGHYRYRDVLSKELIMEIKGAKNRIRICSLSRTPENPLMWAHYADGHRGVVIGVQADKNKYDVQPVQYTGLSNVENRYHDNIIETAKQIFCHKHQVWEYEEEERLFVEQGGQFAKVKIEKIILGSRMSNQDKSFVAKIIQKISPYVEVSNSEIERFEY